MIAMKRTNRTKRAKKLIRFSTPRMLSAIASLGRVAVSGEIASKLGDDSRDGRRKLSVMLNRAKRVGLVKHAPTGSYGAGSGGRWSVTAAGRKTLAVADR
jgi:hypothetical protein